MPNDFSQERIDESFDRQSHRMAAVGERDRWLRTYPEPLPPGYILHHQWDHGDGCGRVHVCPRMITEPELRALADALAFDLVPRPPKPASPAEDRDEPSPAAMDIGRMSDADIDTAAAELGVQFPPKASRRTKVALLNKAKADAAKSAA